MINSITNQSAGDPTIFNPISIIRGYGISGGNSYGSQTISLNLENNPEFQNLKQKIENIEKQLCILYPNESLQEKYPALQEAYDAYQVILRLVNDQNSK